MVYLDVAASQIVGARDYQEDAAAHAASVACDAETPVVRTFERDTDAIATVALPEGRALFVVADGMGGHAAGDVASQLICDCFLGAMSAHYSDPNRRADPAAGRLGSALHAANRGIADAIDLDDSLSSMGATMVGVEVAGLAMLGDEKTKTVRRAEGSDCDHVAGEASEPETTRPATSHVAVAERPNNTLTGVTLNWVSVGDSPLYLVRDGEIAMLNEDHSLAPALDQLVAEGRMSAEDARNDHRRHMLRSAVSGEVMELIDVSARPLEIETGDIIIIATDGLQTLEPDEIARIAIGYRGDGASVVCDALLRAVGDTRAPYQDNATVIVLIAKDGSA